MHETLVMIGVATGPAAFALGLVITAMLIAKRRQERNANEIDEESAITQLRVDRICRDGGLERDGFRRHMQEQRDSDVVRLNGRLKAGDNGK